MNTQKRRGRLSGKALVFLSVPYEYAYTPEELEPMLKGLMLRLLITSSPINRRADVLHYYAPKGASFARVGKSWRKSLYNKFLITVITALISGTIAAIIKLVIIPLIQAARG